MSADVIFGSFNIDGSEFNEYGEDLGPKECQGFQTTREGYSEVYVEILANHALYGAKAGIPDADVTDMTTANERIARIDLFLPAYLKAAEILTETRAKLDDQRQRIALNSAASVDRRSLHHPELLAKYQKTREYRSAIAKKAAKTRAKKAAEAKAKAAASATPAPSAPVAPIAPIATPTSPVLAQPGSPQAPATPSAPQAPTVTTTPQAPVAP
jgi:hypothetical protein